MRTPHDAPRQDNTLLLRPLSGTSFLLATFLADHDHFGAGTVVLSSASSKTAYGVALLLPRGDAGVTVAGLTSERKRGFVESLGVYDRAVVYGEIERALAGEDPVAYVDMAGDPAVRGGAPRRGGPPAHSAVVGASHLEEQARATRVELPGPAHGEGPEDVRRDRLSLVGGQVDPRQAHVPRLA